MCGIAGIISLKKEGHALGKHIEAISGKMRHRGPDGEGFLLYGNGATSVFSGDDTVLVSETSLPDYFPQQHIAEAYAQQAVLALAHRRLSIVDLSPSGHQPMSYRERYWIVFNGEVYNFPELRTELEQAGYTFHSHSDTEVIMAAYDKWGTDCFQKFNGMWAMAILDTLTNQVILSRDRFGIKPLHYYCDGEVFLFASEIKALLTYADIRTSPDEAYCKEYLLSGPKEYTRETAFRNIYRMDAASYAVIDLHTFDGQLQPRVFWKLTPSNNSEKFSEKRLQELSQSYYELLNDAVKLRLRADVKVGSALSGGLDSSAVVSIMNQQLEAQHITGTQETFSSVYKSENLKDCDESEYIDKIAGVLNVHSNQIEPKEADIPAAHRKMIYHMDTPPESTCMSGWHTFKLVGESEVTVTLDGQGADEQQAGYLIYLVNYLSQQQAQEAAAFNRIPGSEKFTGAATKLRWMRKILPQSLLQFLLKKMGLSPDYLLPVNERLVKDTLTNLLTLIHYSDRISMAFSVESRMPYMDYRLAEFLATVPDVYKLHDGWTKYIARVAMQGKLPDEITWRKDKMGWPIPEEQWFRGNLKETFCTTIEQSPFLKKLGVGQDIRERINGKEPITRLVRLYNLAVWHNVFFEEA